MSRRDPALEDDERDLLLGALPDAALPGGRAESLWQRVAERTATPRGFDVVCGDTGTWHTALPGLRIKPLRVDPLGRTQTSLWRLDPGARVPAHAHHAEEECLILEGSLQWGERVYRAGDYLVAHPGGEHEEFTSPDGALFLIRSELTEPLRRLFGAD